MKFLGPRSPAIAPAAAPGHDDNSHFEFSRDLEAFKRKRNIYIILYIYISESDIQTYSNLLIFFLFSILATFLADFPSPKSTNPFAGFNSALVNDFFFSNLFVSCLKKSFSKVHHVYI